MATISNTLALQDKMSGALKSVTTALNSTLSAMRTIKGIELGPEFSKAAADIKLAEKAIENLNSDMRNFTNNTKDGFTLMKGIAVNALSTIANYAKNALRNVISLTDNMTQSTARLSLIAGESETVAGIQESIFQAAQRSRGEYLGILDTVAKLRLQASDAFTSTEEAVYFAEQLNKQFVISGTSASGVESVMYNLTQALSSGVLRGQDLNAVFANTPMIVKSIADYMGISVGEIRKMASEGALSADVIKNAMFAAADETNAKFAEMPMTIGQIWTIASNNILVAVQPLIEQIAAGAQFIYENWNTIEPIFVGIAGGIAVAAIAWGIYTAATWLAVAANQALIISMLTNPFLWVAIGIGVLIGFLYKLIQSVGGFKIAWQIAVNFVLDLWDKMQMGFLSAATGIQNGMGSMKVGTLNILQGLVNGAIDIINKFIEKINKIPGISIDFLEHATLGATAAVEEEAKRQAREADLSAFKAEKQANITNRALKLAEMREEAAREAAKVEPPAVIPSELITGSGSGKALKTANQNEVDINKENLRFLLDVATAGFRVKYTELTPQVVMNFTGDIRETVDVNSFANELAGAIADIAYSDLSVSMG